jgi:hypothetical protein
MPTTRFTPTSTISPFLYLNRCKGGCTVHSDGATNDARTQMSAIPGPGTYTIGEFANAFGQTGTTGTCLLDSSTSCTMDVQCGTNGPCSLADVEWAAVVQCMKEVYSPFAIQITDQVPAGGVSYTEAIIAGQPGDIGLSSGILGIAPLANDCSAQDNVISFSFANHHSPADRVNNICWTAAQETAHAFGLDHEFSFPGNVGGGPVLPQGQEGAAGDGESACNDPMTYSTLCGGEKFFRNEAAKCGEYSARVCKCGGTQNSHLKILSVFGAGQSLIPPPTVAIDFPTGGMLMPNAFVTGHAGSKRGVATVELWLNGFKWASTNGTPFALIGQPNPSMYSIGVPGDVPDSVIDIQLKAFDDLGVEGDSATVTVTKGKAGGCNPSVMNADGTIDTCALGQTCDSSGRCAWPAPTGMLGDKCTYPQFCTSGLCEGTSASDRICTQTCLVGASDACPAGYACAQTSGNDGVCFPPDNAGCCSTAGGSSSPWAACGLCALVLGVVRRRRRA